MELLAVIRALEEVKTIFKASPSRRTAAHYGARMAFLDDGTLLVTSGDGFNYRERAQYLDNHYGKIIRINTDGSIPGDNPFLTRENAKPEIWSYGHRNLQGITVINGIVYENEHGPMGGDELNIAEPSKNYGWPAITYGKDYSGATISPFTEKEGMEQPIKYWVPSIAPSGMAFYDGNLFPEWKGSLLISALVPGDVRRLTLNGSKVIEEEVLFSDLGRIRDVATSPDGTIILATDGPKGKLIRVVEGEILDIVVDLRNSSKSFGDWASYKISRKNKKQLFIPEGFAHGFLSLTNDTTVMYKVSDYWNSKDEYTLRYDDQKIKLKLPFLPTSISQKDRYGLSFEDIPKF